MTDLDIIRRRAAEYAALPVTGVQALESYIPTPAEQLADDVPALLEYIDYQAYQLAVCASYKDSSSPVRPLTYEEWQPRKQEATAWLYAVPVSADIVIGKRPDDPMPETKLSDYTECPCGCNEGYTADGSECGCCDSTGAVTKDHAAQIAAEDAADEGDDCGR